MCMLFRAKNPVTSYVQTRNSLTFVQSILVLYILWLHVFVCLFAILTDTLADTYIFTIHRHTQSEITTTTTTVAAAVVAPAAESYVLKASGLVIQSLCH